MKPPIAPLALDYLTESLTAHGHEVEILDLCFSEDWRREVNSWFKHDQSDIVGVTIRNTDDCYFASRDWFIPYYVEVISEIRSQSEAPIVIGGAGFSTAPTAILKATNADYGIIGDGEIALSLLALRLEHGEDPFDIPGLVYRKGNTIRINPPFWPDMASMPCNTRQWLDNSRYFAEGGQIGIETKRGCPGHCIYCADPLGKGTTCRLRLPSEVAKEIKALVEQGIDYYHLCDSEFNIPLKHAEAVCREIIDLRLGDKIRWYTYASPVPFNDELAILMKKAGCQGINFGADSGDDAVLKSLGRDFTSEDLRYTADICHRHGITFMYDLLIGGPGETFESVERTINLMKEIQPHRVGMSIGIRIYNGTPLSQLVQHERLKKQTSALHGQVDGNDEYIMPVYYLSPEVGIDVVDFISELTKDDSRFLHASRDEIEGNYNYNDNTVLMEAVKKGYRGAYWDILRKLQEGIPP
jgi:radical SAM superfamily enzyme YgiQ (UPF0313 family)